MKRKILSITVISLICLHTSSFAKNISIGTIEIGGGSTLEINSFERELEKTNGEATFDTTILKADALYYVRSNLGVGATWFYSSQEITGRLNTEDTETMTS